jgi:hypothetical protein
VPVAPGAEASLEYRFRADPILGATPPREFALALHLFYEVWFLGVGVVVVVFFRGGGAVAIAFTVVAAVVAV